MSERATIARKALSIALWLALAASPVLAQHKSSHGESTTAPTPLRASVTPMPVAQAARQHMMAVVTIPMGTTGVRTNKPVRRLPPT